MLYADKTRIVNFRLNLLELDEETLGIPEREYTTKIIMPSKEFKNICNNFSIMGDVLKISSDQTNVQFSLAGEIANGVVKYSHNVDEERFDECKENSIGISIRCEEDVSQEFSLQYLQYFTKATILSEKVTFFLDGSGPLLMEYEIGCVGRIHYYLSPKIDEE